MRNAEAEKKLKEAWNRKLDNYNLLLEMYKSQDYKVKRNDETGDHIVSKNVSYDMFKDTPFANLFNFGG